MLDSHSRADSFEEPERRAVASHHDVLTVVDEMAGLARTVGVGPAAENGPLLDQVDPEASVGQANTPRSSRPRRPRRRRPSSSCPVPHAASERTQSDATSDTFRAVERPIRGPKTKKRSATMQSRISK